MGSVERVATLIVLVALATTLVLPDRQTAKVLGAVGSAFQGSIKVATAQR